MNPMNAIYKVSGALDESTIHSASLLDDVTSSLYKNISSLHKSWIDSQKSSFKRMKANSNDEAAYDILTSKSSTFSSEVIGELESNIRLLAKEFLIFSSDTKTIIRLSNVLMEHHPELGEVLFSCKDPICYIPDAWIPSPSDIERTLSCFTSIWNHMEPIKKEDVYKRLEQYTCCNCKDIEKDIAEKRVVVFNTNKAHKAKEYIMMYHSFMDEFKSSITSIKNKLDSMRKALVKMNNHQKEKFISYVKKTEKLDIPEDEKQMMINMAMSNYSQYNEAITHIIEASIQYYAICVRHSIRSFKSYADAIGNIYSIFLERKGLTKI